MIKRRNKIETLGVVLENWAGWVWYTTKMKQPMLIILLIIIFLAVGFFVLNTYTNQQKQGETPRKMEETMEKNTKNDLLGMITPIEHASMQIRLGAQVIDVDPVGGKEKFSHVSSPTIILVTDIHSDHMSADTLKAVSTKATKIVVPQSVFNELPKDIPGEMIIMKNGQSQQVQGIEIEAIPMYNIPESPSAFHTKGRGNGYVLEYNKKRIYIAGDTSATPEMKALKNIDIAFIPMNLPYTMDVNEAADGVLAFKPKIVVPYHYRGSDTGAFKKLVESKDSNIKVELLDFYPAQ